MLSSPLAMASLPNPLPPLLHQRSSSMPSSRLPPRLLVAFSPTPSSPHLRTSIIRAARISPSDTQPTSCRADPEALLVEPPPPKNSELPFKLPGEEPDFWEGPQWNALGFVVQYLWAFGILVALIGCGIAVKTYNIGATDFKETTVYKESLESQFEDTIDSQGVEELVPKDAPALQQSPT